MSGLADFEEGIPERFVPDEMRGELLEAEHLARYSLASQLAPGRRALDAGCGVGYGSQMLAEAGAAAVTGVDVAEAVLESVRPSLPETVTLRAADLRDLPFDDGSFDLIACFEVIEHLEDPDPALDELARVLAPDGVLLISSPNRAVYPPVNPHHHHEYLPEELREALARRLRHVTLLRQHVYLTSAVLADEAFARGDGAPLEGLDLHKLVAGEPGGETFTVAAASRAPLPELRPLALLTGDLELRRWFANSADEQHQLTAHSLRIHELEEHLRTVGDAQGALMEAEQRVAAVLELEERVARLEEDVRREQAATAEARHLVERADRVLRDVLGSPSWRVTAPLRRSKDVLFRGRRR